jgi:hypothetical protein
MVWEYSSSAAGGDAAESKLCPAVAADLEISRFDHVEVAAIPQIGLDNPPAADQLACRRPGHGTAAKSLGVRTKL